MSDATITKSKLFKEDIALATGGTGAVETGTRLTSAGGVVTLTKLDLGHIPYRSFPGTPEDLLDGGQDVDILPRDCLAGRNISAGGTLEVGGVTTLSNLTPAGYVKNSVGGVISTGAIAAADLPTGIDAAKIASGIVTSTAYQYLSGASSNIQAQINAIVAGATVQAPFAILQNRQAQNTSGGTATLGSWLIVPLNTEIEDVSNIIDSSALPAFTLAAGTYRISADILFYFTGKSQARLYNVTDAGVQKNIGTYDIYGTSAYADPGSYLIPAISIIDSTFTIAAGKQFRIEYQVAFTYASGHGYPANYAEEVYSQVKITKIA
jgi:hypothetical protein